MVRECPVCTLIVALALVLALSGIGFAQVSRIYPLKPRWGETLNVTYRPQVGGARFKSSDDVYVVKFLYFPRETRWVWARMEPFRDLFRHTMVVEESLGYAQFYFITLSDWDMLATADVPIYRRDGELAKGAYQQMMSSQTHRHEYRALCEKELSLYPDNVSVYRDKWFVARYAEPDSLSEIIEEDMSELDRREHADTLGLLYSLSYGYLLLGEEKKAREILKEMARKFPSPSLTGYALKSYEYEAYTQGFVGEGPEEVKKLKWDFVSTNSSTEVAQDECLALAWQDGFPLAIIENICKPWMEEESDNPMPYYSLANAYNNKGAKLEEASVLIEKAINMIHQGKLRLYEDISGSMTEHVLPAAYAVMADISFKQQNYAGALGAVQAAHALEKEADPRSYLLEARIWRALSKLSQEESAYLEAWRRGSEEAKDSLRILYEARGGGTEGFEEYLRSSSREAGQEKAAAPSFEVTSLDGEFFALDSLKGNVVVLNFWHTGCGPCRMEIPSLNKLVAEFKDSDVEFIAVALDDENTLRSFLKKKEFTYHIVPAGGGQTAGLFGVRAFPTHILIDRDGNIDTKIIGTSTDIDKRLGIVIRRLLQI